MPRSGADLALLLLGGYRSLVDAAMSELAARGHADFSPVHEFALRSVAAGAESASDLARRLGVSKQAAAKTVAVLVDRGYLSSVTDPDDARRKRLRVTARGQEVLDQGEAVFEDLRARWTEQVGAPGLEQVESTLRRLVGEGPVDPERSGWGEGPA